MFIYKTAYRSTRNFQAYDSEGQENNQSRDMWIIWLLLIFGMSLTKNGDLAYFCMNVKKHIKQTLKVLFWIIQSNFIY